MSKINTAFTRVNEDTYDVFDTDPAELSPNEERDRESRRRWDFLWDVALSPEFRHAAGFVCLDKEVDDHDGVIRFWFDTDTRHEAERDTYLIRLVVDRVLRKIGGDHAKLCDKVSHKIEPVVDDEDGADPEPLWFTGTIEIQL